MLREHLLADLRGEVEAQRVEVPLVLQEGGLRQSTRLGGSLEMRKG